MGLFIKVNNINTENLMKDLVSVPFKYNNNNNIINDIFILYDRIFDTTFGIISSNCGENFFAPEEFLIFQ